MANDSVSSGGGAPADAVFCFSLIAGLCFHCPCPVSSGTRLCPCMPAGGAMPFSSSRVGKTSIVCTTSSDMPLR